MSPGRGSEPWPSTGPGIIRRDDIFAGQIAIENLHFGVLICAPVLPLRGAQIEQAVFGFAPPLAEHVIGGLFEEEGDPGERPGQRDRNHVFFEGREGDALRRGIQIAGAREVL